MPSERDNYARVQEWAQVPCGMTLFGVADMKPLVSTLAGVSGSTRTRCRSAVSLGVPLLNSVIDDIEDHPTALYVHHYRQVNYLLDRAALTLSSLIQEQGAWAMPIGASQIIDWQNLTAHISHREVAAAAGLGWWGRNNLLVHPRYGSRIRLVTVLTDLPLCHDQPHPGNCGTCRRCLDICPANAIHEQREQFDLAACTEQLRTFKKRHNLPHYVCGLCIRACAGPNGPVP